MKKPILNIVDGNYFVNYASHSAVASLQNEEGTKTGALHVFLNNLGSIYQNLRGKMIVVFDGGHSKYRTDIYPDYKKRLEKALTQKDIDRETMKSFAFKTLDELLPIMGIPTIRIDGEEADDVVYILNKYLSDTYKIYNITSDEDYVQMAKLGSTVYLYRQDKYISADNFKDLYGFDLHGFTLYKAIKGDSSDNIKGVPGVGEVGAKNILQNMDYFTIEALYDACNGSSDKKKKAVLENIKVVKRNIWLMDLEYADVDEELIQIAYKKACKRSIVDLSAVIKIFNKYELQNVAGKWLPILNEEVNNDTSVD